MIDSKICSESGHLITVVFVLTAFLVPSARAGAAGSPLAPDTVSFDSVLKRKRGGKRQGEVWLIENGSRSPQPLCRTYWNGKPGLASRAFPDPRSSPGLLDQNLQRSGPFCDGQGISGEKRSPWQRG